MKWVFAAIAVVGIVLFSRPLAEEIGVTPAIETVVASGGMIPGGSAWVCDPTGYHFHMSREGVVKATNDSDRNEPGQKAHVYINGDEVKDSPFDVPALKSGESAKIAEVDTPGDEGFSWKVVGTIDCKNEGCYKPISTPTPIPPTYTSTPTDTPTETSTDTPTPTETPSPVLTDTPTSTFTPTPTPAKKPPREEEEEEVVEVPCYELELEIEARKDPESGYVRLWRIWTNGGALKDELDLFRLFSKFDTVADIQDASIEPNARCEVVVSLKFEGEDQHDLFVFGSTGSYYRQVTNSDEDELSPWWLSGGKIVFSDNGLLYLIDSLGRNVRAFEVDEKHLAGEAPAGSPRSDRWLTFVAPTGEIVTLNLVASELVNTGYQGDIPAWTPDGSGVSWSENGKVKLLNFETGEVIEVQDGERVVWSPERGLEGHGHLEQHDQRWWLTPHQLTQMTGEAPPSDLSAQAEEAFWAKQLTHKPLDWKIDSQLGQRLNLTAANDWFANRTAESVEPEAETEAVAPAPICANYDGVSVVDCLKSVGMDSSFQARAKLAFEYGVVDFGEYAGTAAQNVVLLAALVGE